MLQQQLTDSNGALPLREKKLGPYCVLQLSTCPLEERHAVVVLPVLGQQWGASSCPLPPRI